MKLEFAGIITRCETSERAEFKKELPFVLHGVVFSSGKGICGHADFMLPITNGLYRALEGQSVDHDTIKITIETL